MSIKTYSTEQAVAIGKRFVTAVGTYGETTALIRAAAATDQLHLLDAAIGVAAGVKDAGKRKNALAAWKVGCNRTTNEAGTMRVSFEVDGDKVKAAWQAVRAKAVKSDKSAGAVSDGQGDVGEGDGDTGGSLDMGGGDDAWKTALTIIRRTGKNPVVIAALKALLAELES